jgi:hypothetical protein
MGQYTVQTGTKTRSGVSGLLLLCGFAGACAGSADPAASDEPEVIPGQTGGSAALVAGAGATLPAGAAGMAAVPGAMGAAGSAATPTPGQSIAGAGAGPVVAGSMAEPVPNPGGTGTYDYEGEQVALDADLVIASGETLRVGPGTTFTASGVWKVQVAGTLIVEGSMEAPVRFVGMGVPDSWHGIVIASGGTLTASHVEIGGARYGIHAQPGSMFSVDYADIGTSFKAAVIESDGSFDHTRFHASGNPLFSPVNEVSIDDVNGTLTILSASPTITNSTFDGSAALVDMVRVGGDSTPVFDHVHIKEAHCGIHANGGVNNAPVVRNSVFELLGYGLMVYATKPTIEDNVFLMNGNDIGFCFEATADNAPTMRNNFYSSGAPIIDPTCFQIGTTDSSPAAAMNPSAGPVGW